MSGAGHIIDDRYGLPTDKSLSPGAVTLDEKSFLFERLLGFFDIKALEIALDRGLITRLSSTPLTSAALATACGLPERSVRFLLISLMGNGFVKQEAADLYSPTALGRKYFDENSPCYLGTYVKYLAWLADSLPRWAEGMAADKPIWDHHAHGLDVEGVESSEQKNLISSAMASSQLLLSHTILSYVDLSRSRHLLDIGGSQGLFSAAVLTRYPTIRSTIFEPQQVRPTTRRQIEQWGLPTASIWSGVTSSTTCGRGAAGCRRSGRPACGAHGAGLPDVLAGQRPRHRRMERNDDKRRLRRAVRCGIGGSLRAPRHPYAAYPAASSRPYSPPTKPETTPTTGRGMT